MKLGCGCGPLPPSTRTVKSVAATRSIRSRTNRMARLDPISGAAPSDRLRAHASGHRPFARSISRSNPATCAPAASMRSARSSAGRPGSKTASRRGRPSTGDPGRSKDTTFGRIVSSSLWRKLTDVARTNARSCSSNRSRTSRGSRTAANPVVKVCNSTAVAHDFSWSLPDAQAGAGPGGEPEPDPDTDEDEREEGTRVLSA